mmetsp:Transcript_11778/g.24048  ORF Transcript_11778/g.24048 Transcript_11778/m.24048 type:complete len:166 (-) Transcript_11778:205-702(-)
MVTVAIIHNCVLLRNTNASVAYCSDDDTTAYPTPDFLYDLLPAKYAPSDVLFELFHWQFLFSKHEHTHAPSNILLDVVHWILHTCSEEPTVATADILFDFYVHHQLLKCHYRKPHEFHRDEIAHPESVGTAGSPFNYEAFWPSDDSNIPSANPDIIEALEYYQWK